MEYIKGSDIADDERDTLIRAGRLRAWRQDIEGEQWFALLTDGDGATTRTKFPTVVGDDLPQTIFGVGPREQPAI